MATNNSGNSGEKGEGDGEHLWLVPCPSCKKSVPVHCEKCRCILTEPQERKRQLNIGKARNVNVIQHQVVQCDSHFKDKSHGESNTGCKLGISSTGDVYIHSLKTLTIAQKQTFINIDSADKKVTVNVATDLDQMEDASDGVLMMKSDWTSTSGEPCPSRPRLEVLITQLINERTDNFFLKVLSEILKEDVPQSVVRSLYDKFRLRLLGLTKNLEFLMEVDADQVEEVKGQASSVQQELAQLVPEEQREKVIWGEFFNIPVQCSDDVLAAEMLPHDVEEDGSRTIQGALSLACQYGNHETVFWLLKHKNVDMRALDRDGRSPFHIACRYGQYDLLDALVGAGADVEERDRNGWSPLDHACDSVPMAEGKRLNTVRWLLEQGADVKSVGPDGHTALDLARQAGYQDVVDLMMKDRA